MGRIKFIGTWDLSKQIEIEHRTIKFMIESYRNEFEKWGLMAMVNRKCLSLKGGGIVKEYILNEKQATYVCMLLGNTEKVRKIKQLAVGCCIIA